MGEAEIRTERWRQRAEECRTLADGASNMAVRDSYLHMAKAYDRLADQWQERANIGAAKRAQEQS